MMQQSGVRLDWVITQLTPLYPALSSLFTYPADNNEHFEISISHLVYAIKTKPRRKTSTYRVAQEIHLVTLII